MNTYRRHLLGALGAGLTTWLAPVALAQSKPVVEVWKDPNCGCCKDWIAHMEQSGFKTVVYETGNNGARAKLGLPMKYASCHTALVDGYVIEGHVPAADIRRLIREKPKALGLAVPGMPVGSPGMDGPEYKGRKDKYDVLLVAKDGGNKVYQSY